MASWHLGHMKPPKHTQRRNNFIVFALLVLAVIGASQYAGTAKCNQAQNSYIFIDYHGDSDVRVERRSCGSVHAHGTPTLTSRAVPRRIVHALLYMNEEDLLHVRFLELYDIVDVFIIMESPVTFQGREKPLLFQQSVCKRFAPFADKVVHVVINHINGSDLPQTGASDAWSREHASRNAILATTSLLNMQPGDLMLTSDADEIPTSAAVLEGANYLANDLMSLAGERTTIPIVEFELKAYVYSLYHHYGGSGGAKLFPFWSTSICSFQDIRFTDKCNQAQALARPRDAGIHASYFFPPELITQRIKSFAHREFDQPQFTEVNSIKENIKQNKAPDFREITINSNNPFVDVGIMAFKPAARNLLLAQSEELHRLQEN